jgi:hypothetical protein
MTDSRRDQLARVLEDFWTGKIAAPGPADALLPHVDRMCADARRAGAAEALNDLADDLNRIGYGADWLRKRAAALTDKAGT